MRKSIAATTAIAVVLLIGAPAKQAEAMPAPSPNQLGLGAGPVTNTVVVCGPWGCRWRPVWGVYRPYPCVPALSVLGLAPSLLVGRPRLGMGRSWMGLARSRVGLAPRLVVRRGLRLHGSGECRDELRAGFRQRKPARREGMPV